MKQQLSINKKLPKKSLGQNFIKDKNFILKLSSLILSDRQTNIFEIGPETGNLTSFILKKDPKKVYVIEKDDELADSLNEIFNE